MVEAECRRESTVLPMRRLVLTIRILSVRVAFAFGRLLPLQRRVVLATAHASRIAGNLAFVHDELRRRSPAIPVVVIAHAPARSLRGRAASLALSVIAGYHLARARVFVVDDYFFPIYVIRPRRGTTIVQTWHASGAFKKIGYSVFDKSFGADEALTSQVAIHSNYDVCLMASQAAAAHYAAAFRQPLSRFVSRLGIPRTDVLFGDRVETIKAAVRRRYAIPEGRKVILYAPTFRGDRVTEARTPQDLDLRTLQRTLGDGYVLLLRLHPFVRERMPIGPELAGFAIDVSDYPDINELMLVSDLLVTDYSSAIYEFSLLGRPMVFFAPDHDAYERERGFYFDYRTGVPGPVFETTQQVVYYIRAGEFDLDHVKAFARASFEVADGRSSARFVDEIVLPGLAGQEVVPAEAAEVDAAD
jgi:CDP-glycerol glycerophosphotransferase (TagB/SpsB family)